ncbi:MAG: hypothetical protein A2097_10900 [Desulfobacula sp. GWF2_41_7]|nr:MAG: hypothetical protein A2097_10900 [Desulfobacula sp. GWF2_41_7]
MSFLTPDFSTLTGIGIITWEMETATPLCIKSGTTSLWNQASSTMEKKPSKIRHVDSEYNFYKKGPLADDASISDFYYTIAIDQEQLVLTHEIPASGIRGALRTYSIKRLAHKEHWNAALFPEKENTKLPIEATKERDDLKRIEYSKNLKTALKTPGWQLVRNIFGLAADTMDAEIENETIKGRLQVETGSLESISKEQFQKNVFDGNFKTFEPGPTNGRMLFTTRNPIDRVTHAAKNKGLHSFTELAPGNRFLITLRFLNPIPEDLGMVALWEQGLHQGLLRMGGLKSAGRGRLDVKSTSVNLFLKHTDEFSGLKPGAAEVFSNDILSGLFPSFEIPDWKTETKSYLNLLQQSYNRFQGGKIHE